MKLNHNKKSVKISLNLFALYAVLVCGVVFALPAFAASDPLAFRLLTIHDSPTVPRPQPAQSRLSHSGRWAGDYLCQGNP